VISQQKKRDCVVFFFFYYYGQKERKGFIYSIKWKPFLAYYMSLDKVHPSFPFNVNIFNSQSMLFKLLLIFFKSSNIAWYQFQVSTVTLCCCYYCLDKLRTENDMKTCRVRKFWKSKWTELEVEAVRAGEKLTYTNLPVSFHIRTRFIFFCLSDMLDIICRAPRKDNTTCLGLENWQR
jgi:hypothetical protein